MPQTIVAFIATVVYLVVATEAQQDCSALATAGNCSFYDCLSSRYQCGDTDFALAYGKRYCLRFMQRRNCFTANGQNWISATSLCLMSGLSTQISSLSSCRDIQRVALSLHQSCYAGTNNRFCSNIFLSDSSCTNLQCLSSQIFNDNDYFSRLAYDQVYRSVTTCSQDIATQFQQISEGCISNSPATVQPFLTTIRNLLRGCTSIGLDLIFVVDASGSIGSNNFITIKSFMTSVLSVFDISSTTTRVGVIRFSSRASILIPLGLINDHRQLNNTINSISYTAGGTATHIALNLLPSAFVNARTSQGVPRVAVVITDGVSNSPLQTARAAQQVHSAGISVYSFGIGSGVNQAELRAIASNPNNVFYIGNFASSSFANALQPLRISACTTPAMATVGSPLNTTLQMNESRLLAYSFPNEGMTLDVDIRRGDLLIRGSFSIQNPTVLTQDFSIQSAMSSDVNYYISPNLYQSSTSSLNITTQQFNTTDKNVFISVAGLTSTNTFTLNTTLGNVTRNAGTTQIAKALLLFILLGIVVFCQ